MKVRLYKGSLKLVEKSGVGRAVHHQEAMMEATGTDICRAGDRDADIVNINTVFPDSVAAAIAAKLRGQKVIYYGHSTMEDFRRSFKYSDLLDTAGAFDSHAKSIETGKNQIQNVPSEEPLT